MFDCPAPFDSTKLIYIANISPSGTLTTIGNVEASLHPPSFSVLYDLLFK